MLVPSTSDGKTNLAMTTKQYWSGHVAAVKVQAITTKAYAQRHGLVLSTLYYWQRKLKVSARLTHLDTLTDATAYGSDGREG